MKNATELHNESLSPKSNNIQIYNEWAKTYDNYVDSLDYMGPKNIVKSLHELIKNQKKYVQILDFGCGTGKIGEELKKQISNYYNLEGIDISQNMLKFAEKKNVYNKLTCLDLTKESYNNKYDIILSSGVFLEGHVNISNINKLYKLLNKNGLLLFTIRETFKDNNSEDFYKYVENNKNFISYSIIDIEYLKNVKCKLVIIKA
jgi:predicted TPR repeat methyltransferase